MRAPRSALAPREAAPTADESEACSRLTAPLDCPVVDRDLGDRGVETVTESALAEFIANGAVESITIRETPDGYETLVAMIWAPEKQARIVTQKTRETKYWSSLDRLVQHLSRLGPPLIKIDTTAKHGAAKHKRKTGTK